MLGTNAECGVAMRNAEYRTAEGSVKSACHVAASARRDHYRSCLNRPAPLSANNIPHSAFRIPQSLIVRSTADHPGTPNVKSPGGGPVLGTNAECGMRTRNAEYRTAEGSVKSACHVAASARAITIGPV